MRIVDCRGLACPQPVINTRRAIEAEPGEPLTVLVDSTTSRDNLLVMAEGLGREARVEEDGAGFRVIIASGSAAAPAAGEASAPAVAATGNAGGPLVLVLGSDRLGQGDETLGGILMKAFLQTMLDVETPATIVCLNRGVFLSTEGSAVLEPLRTLASRGVEVLSCGTCLDFYGLKEKLQVGVVSNMFTIAQRLTGAGRLIQW